MAFFCHQMMKPIIKLPRYTILIKLKFLYLDLFYYFIVTVTLDDEVANSCAQIINFKDTFLPWMPSELLPIAVTISFQAVSALFEEGTVSSFCVCSLPGTMGS